MSLYTYNQVERLKNRYGTSDPFELLDALGVIVGETSSFTKLKGYCFLSCKSTYVMISSFLGEEEKRIVAAHELGHIVMHKRMLSRGPIADNTMFNANDKMEFEANTFAADLLISDSEIYDLSEDGADFFSMCQSLYVVPEILSFKLQSMNSRGDSFSIPAQIHSRFLAR